MERYERVVAAAVAETTSKFRLAEALALDIPPRQEGQAATASGEKPVLEYLAEARQAIIDAGGEPRSVDTLEAYRLTALWVKDCGSAAFRWVERDGHRLSFTVHREAFAAGKPYEEFAANPAATKRQGREQAYGKPMSDVTPERAISGWSPGQRAAAARELMAEPETASAALRDPAVQQAAAGAIVNDPDAAKAAAEAVDEHRRRVRAAVHREPEEEPMRPAPRDVEAENAAAAFARLIDDRRDLADAAARLKRVYDRGAVEAESRPAILADLAEVRRWLDALDLLMTGKPVDEEFREFIEGR